MILYVVLQNCFLNFNFTCAYLQNIQFFIYFILLIKEKTILMIWIIAQVNKKIIFSKILIMKPKNKYHE